MSFPIGVIILTTQKGRKRKNKDKKRCLHAILINFKYIY
jgi:hypothetical protein